MPSDLPTYIVDTSEDCCLAYTATASPRIARAVLLCRAGPHWPRARVRRAARP